MLVKGGKIKASKVTILDSGEHYTSDNVEGALREISISLSGQDEFVELIDTPSNYISQSGAFIKVNSVEDALEFVGPNDFVKDFHIDWGTAVEQVSAVDVPIADAGSYYTGTEVETALAEIYPAFASTTVGSSGASLVGLPSLDSTPATLRTFIDGVSSSLYYTGGLITENSAGDGTIDISEVSGSIKLTTTGSTMASFTISALVGQALDADGQNYVVINYNSGTPIFDIVTSEPNHSTVMSIGTVYREATTNYLHILQGGHNFTDMPWKTQRRFIKVDGYQRGTGLASTESLVEPLGIVMTAGTLYRGVAEFSLDARDTGDFHDIFDVTANNTIVLANAEGDVTAQYERGTQIAIHDSTGGTNDGCYNVDSSSWDGTNTIVIVAETTLTLGLADDGHLHYHVFRPYYYNGSAWVNGTQTGAICDIALDNFYYNDITSGLVELIANRYGVQWIYKDLHGDMMVVYGQGSYTLTQAKEAEPPGSLPDIIVKIGYLIAKVIIQKSAGTWNSVFYPWSTTFSATGAAVHNDLGGIQGGTTDEYYHSSSAEYTGTGTGNFVRATSPTLVTPLLGTPTSGTLTNCIGLPASSVTAGTFGTGAYVFDNTVSGITTLTATSLTDGTATLTTGVLTGLTEIKPSADSTSALTFAQADGTDYVYYDSTNKREGIGGLPSVDFHVQQAGNPIIRVENTQNAANVAKVEIFRGYFGSQALVQFGARDANDPFQWAIGVIENSATPSMGIWEDAVDGGDYNYKFAHGGGFEIRESSADSIPYLSIINDKKNWKWSVVGDSFDQLQLDEGGTSQLAFFDNAAMQYQFGAIFNESGGDFDFRVESNNQVNMFFVDGGNDVVAIKTATPDSKYDFHVDGTVLIGDGTSGAQGLLNINDDAETVPTGGGEGLAFGDVGASYKWIQSYDSAPLSFNPIGNDVVVGGTSLSTSALAEIKGDFALSAATPSLLFEDTTGSAEDFYIQAIASDLKFGVSLTPAAGDDRFCINTAGIELLNNKKFTKGVYVVKTEINFDDSSPTAIHTVEEGEVVVDVYVHITTAWDGNGTFKIGDGGDDDGFTSTSFFDQTVAGAWYGGSSTSYYGAYLYDYDALSDLYLKKNKIYTTGDNIDAFITAGTSSQGVADIFVVIQKLE